MSKAQVTLFIILGIVILIIFGFVFVITERTQNIEAEIEKPIADFLRSKTVNYYVMTCLDKASKEALTLIGDQGGFIYNELIDWYIPYVEYKGKKVAYQIYSDLSSELKPKNIAIDDPPYYPCFTNNPYVSKEECYRKYNHNKLEYVFGSTSEPEHNINPDLCKKKNIIAGYVCTCSNSLNCKYSIQSQLEDYIEKKVKACTDFSNIKGYDISKGDIKANVSFSDNSVLFKIDFPITIEVKGSEPIIKILQFSLPQQVRLKILHSLSRELIEKDKDDINFDIIKDGQDLANIYGDIKIIGDNTYTNASIIILEDSKSKIDGKNYLYMFARENRAPALDYMEFISFNGYDLYIIENQTLNFTPTAFDPDENKLIYNYSSSDWSSVANALKASLIYTNPNPPDECVHPFSGVSEKERCATYDLTEADAGEHILNITPKDPEWLFDYQNISILVDDIPDIDLVLNNEFDDIDNNLTSIEDPFKFDVSGSTDEYPKKDDLEFKLWKKVMNNIEVIYDWTDEELKIPKKNDYTSIKDIKNKGFTLPPTTQTFILDAKNKASTPSDNIAVKKEDITVYECLPHRSLHASYPFHNIKWDNHGPKGEVPENEFQGNHTCCSDEPYSYGTYESSSKECYKLEDYGCIADFSSGGDYYDPGELIARGIATQTIVSTGPDDDKDVYKRTLIRKCSGNRGNICGGDVTTYKIEFHHTCTSGHCTHNLDFNQACVI